MGSDGSQPVSMTITVRRSFGRVCVGGVIVGGSVVEMEREKSGKREYRNDFMFVEIWHVLRFGASLLQLLK